eukprot:4695042-Alexandrium_andersonii.AAC.1
MTSRCMEGPPQSAPPPRPCPCLRQKRYATSCRVRWQTHLPPAVARALSHCMRALMFTGLRFPPSLQCMGFVAGAALGLQSPAHLGGMCALAGRG